MFLGLVTEIQVTTVVVFKDHYVDWPLGNRAQTEVMGWRWSHGQMLQQCWGVGKWGFSGPAVLDMDTSVRPRPTHATAPGLQLTSQSQSSQKKNKLFLLLSCLLAPACQERKTSKETQWWHHRFPWAHHHVSIVFTQRPAQSHQERAVAQSHRPPAPWLPRDGLHIEKGYT